MGSSPLSRGILNARHINLRWIRIIPALAGNTTPAKASWSASSDHPRSRGEYMGGAVWIRYLVGSSPLSRGIRMVNSQEEVRERIIPALAGNTTSGSVTLAALPDHPRSRGEYQIQAENRRLLHGSSPLSRGIRDERFQCHQHSGIIPALAGNTPLFELEILCEPDHPRSRGEYPLTINLFPLILGSSPLSRGIQTVSEKSWEGGRIIPALAGNTPFQRGTTGSATDHPRSRGEYIPPDFGPAFPGGSSPLSRGILRLLPAGRVSGRIIPALAGNTVPVA